MANKETVNENEQAAAAAKKEEEAKKAATEAAVANQVRAAAAAAEGAGEKAPYAVAAGMSVSTLRGIVDAGNDIWPRDFHRGEEDIKDLLGRKALVRQ